MASTTDRVQCVKCGKHRATVKCAGCSQDFCLKHLPNHHEELSQQLDEIEVDRDLLRDMINKQRDNPNNLMLIEQVDTWEQDSIRRVQQTADECRQMLLKHASDRIPQIEEKLVQLTDQLRKTRQDDDFNEVELTRFRQQVAQLSEELRESLDIAVQDRSDALVTKISVVISSKFRISFPQITNRTVWKQNGVTITNGCRRGDQLNQLNNPCGIHVDDDQTVYIVDYNNHRIVQWNKNVSKGQIVAGGNGKGGRLNQLNRPTDLVVDKNNDSIIICDYGNRRVIRWPRHNGTQGQTIISDIDCTRLTRGPNGDLYVSNWKQHEVRRWGTGDKEGTIVAGGNGKGNQLNQFNEPSYIFVDVDQSMYVSDYNNHRVMKWVKGAREGVVVAGGQGRGDSFIQLSRPEGIIVDQLGNVYVADQDNHRIMRWLKGSRQGSVVVGGNGIGKQSNQLNDPFGLAFDREGALYVADCQNDRIQKFDIERN